MAWKSAPRTAVRASVSDDFLMILLMEDTGQDPCVLDCISHRPDHQLRDQVACLHTCNPGTWRLRREDLKLEVSLGYVRFLSQNQQKGVHSGLLGAWLSGSELA
jgi:hypothetical protein